MTAERLVNTLRSSGYLVFLIDEHTARVHPHPTDHEVEWLVRKMAPHLVRHLHHEALTEVDF